MKATFDSCIRDTVEGMRRSDSDSEFFKWVKGKDKLFSDEGMRDMFILFEKCQHTE